jgi:hypothetical protein
VLGVAVEAVMDFRLLRVAFTEVWLAPVALGNEYSFV